MKIALRIAIAELKTLFYSPIAWLLLVIFIVQCDQFYFSAVDYYARLQSMGMQYESSLRFITSGLFGPPFGVFPSVINKLYLYIPLLTMGLISRETSSGTIRLLYSSPITTAQIVFGKFIAMMCYNVLMISIVAILCIVSSVGIQSADVTYLLSGLTGIYLLLCAYTAIGLFMSGLTTYQVVAAVSTLALLALLQYVGAIGQGIDFVRDLTYYLAISNRTEQFLVGLVRGEDVIYFLIIICAFLSFTIIKLSSGRERKTVLQTAGRYAFICMAAVVAGYLSTLHVLKFYYDATSTKRNTLTVTTQHLLQQLGNMPLEITNYVNLLDRTYIQGAPETRNNYKQRWERYLRFKPDIQSSFVYYYDSAISVRESMQSFGDISLQQYARRIAKANDIDISAFKSAAEARKIINLSPEMNRYVMQLKWKNRTTFLRTYDDQNPFPEEQEIDAAIKRLLMKAPVIGVLQNEQERSIYKAGETEYKSFFTDKTFRNALVNQGFDVEEISPGTDIPADVCAIVIADPRISLPAETISHLRSFIQRGGSLMMATEPGRQALLNPVLSTLGVRFADGQLLQKSNDFAPARITSFLTGDAVRFDGSLSEDYKNNFPVIMQGAVAINDSGTASFTRTPLLITDSSACWNTEVIKSDSATLSYNPAAGDEKKAFTTALALQRNVNGCVQRIVVCGDADFLSNSQLFAASNTANFDFGTSLFKWFAGGQFPVDVSRQLSKDNRLLFSENHLAFLKTVFYGVIPVLLVLGGSVFLIRRRYQ